MKIKPIKGAFTLVTTPIGGGKTTTLCDMTRSFLMSSEGKVLFITCEDFVDSIYLKIEKDDPNWIEDKLRVEGHSKGFRSLYYELNMFLPFHPFDLLVIDWSKGVSMENLKDMKDMAKSHEIAIILSASEFL